MLSEDLKGCYDALKGEEELGSEELTSKLQIFKDQIKNEVSKLERKDQECKKLLQDLTGEERILAKEDYKHYALEENDYITAVTNAIDAPRKISRALRLEEDQMRSKKINNGGIFGRILDFPKSRCQRIEEIFWIERAFKMPLRQL